MIQAEKKVIIAWNHAQALHYAKMMEWKRAEWMAATPASGIDKLRGLTNVVVFHLRAPRFKPNSSEARAMYHIINELHIMQSANRVAKLNVVNLP